MDEFWIEHRISQNDFHLNPHYEHTYQTVFILDGEILYRIGTQDFHAESGDVILLNTLEEHTLRVLSYPYERWLFQMNPVWFQSEMKNPEILTLFVQKPDAFHPVISPDAARREELRRICGAMAEEYESQDPYSVNVISSLLMVFFVRVLREKKRVYGTERQPSAMKLGYDLLHYLDRNFTEDISVDKVAGAFYLNRHYISHVFKDFTGHGIMEYVITLRMNLAKKLLAETGQSITEVATACGYTDFTYFSKQFRKHVGTTPSHFRKDHQLTEGK